MKKRILFVLLIFTVLFAFGCSKNKTTEVSVGNTKISVPAALLAADGEAVQLKYHTLFQAEYADLSEILALPLNADEKRLLLSEITNNDELPDASSFLLSSSGATELYADYQTEDEDGNLTEKAVYYIFDADNCVYEVCFDTSLVSAAQQNAILEQFT